MKTPTEVCADRIRDLEAQLQMADERIYFLTADNARLRSYLPEPTRITPSGVPFIPER